MAGEGQCHACGSFYSCFREADTCVAYNKDERWPKDGKQKAL